MTRPSMIAAVVLVLAGIGCGAEPKAPATEWSARGKPLTIIAFDDETSWPFQIAEVHIALDGHTVVDHVALAGEQAQWSFEAPFEALSKGEHTVSIRLKAQFSSTRTDGRDGCAVQWRDHRAFIIGDQPVGVRIVVRSDNMTRRFVDRLDVRVAVAGATRALGSHVPPHRTLLASQAVCRDDAPLPFGDHDLSRSGFGPELLR